MAANQALASAMNLQFAVPSAVVSGDPLLVGSIACVAQESYQPPGSVTPTGQVSVQRDGAFFLPVTAMSTLSPAVNAAVGVGDAVYADGGTLDGPTNVTYGFTLDNNSSTGVLWGYALDAVVAGQTTTIRVAPKVG